MAREVLSWDEYRERYGETREEHVSARSRRAVVPLSPSQHRERLARECMALGIHEYEAGRCIWCDALEPA